MSKLKTALVAIGLMITPNIPQAAAQHQTVVQSGSIAVYADPDFRGQSRVFDRPVRDLNRLRFNDTISSVKLRGAWELCEHPDFRGRCVTVDGPVYYLREFGLNDKITSLRPVNSRRGLGQDRQRRVRRERGFEGQTVVFFAQPRDQYGERIRADRGNASQFCRNMGYHDAVYANRSRRNLRDVLCEK